MINKQGFSLLELLITIGLTVSISVISIPLYGNLQASTKLDENLTQIANVVLAAREQSRAGLRNTNHGVYFDLDNDKIILYQGDSYASRTADDQTFDQILDLEPGVSITVTDSDINFASSTTFLYSADKNQVVLGFENKRRILEINQYGIPLEIKPDVGN